MQRRNEPSGTKSPFEGTEQSRTQLLMQTLGSPGSTMSGHAGSTAAEGEAAHRAVKLPSSIPEQQRGERPYYHECYFKYCTAILAIRESSMVTEDLMNGSAAFYGKVAELHAANAVVPPPDEGTPPFGLAFSWNALLQEDAATPPRFLRNASQWDARGHLVKRFQESIAGTCEQAVFVAQRLFRGRCETPSDLIPIENTTSFLSTTFGALIHVWHSTTEAKKYLQSQHIVGQAIAALRLPALAVPISVLFTVHTISVTATTLMPVAMPQRGTKAQLDGPQIQRQLKQLEIYCRARCPFTALPGADGRWYVAETLGVLRAESESQGETNNIARASLFDTFPNMDDFPDTLRKASRRLIDAAVQGILDGVGAQATSVGGIAGVKIHDLVAARVVPKACHAVGVKLSYLYEVLEHPKLSLAVDATGAPPSPMVVAARELVLAEMVCRTFKEMVRAEISCIKTIPHAEAPTAAVSQFLVEVANRCVFNLLTKEDQWAPHVLAVLRIKFSTPEHFIISQGTVTKRCILGYLTSRLGLVFEGGRYCRTSRVSGFTSVVAPTPEAVALHRGDTTQASSSAQAEWKKVLGISNPDLMLACARRQLHVFALCGMFDAIEQCMATLDSRMEERSLDLATRGDMQFACLEALRELLPHNKAAVLIRRLCTEYIKKYAKSFSAKDVDVPIAIYRLQAIIEVLPLLVQDQSNISASIISTTTAAHGVDVVSTSGGQSVDEECGDARLAALELLRRIVMIDVTASATESRWVHPLLISDTIVNLLCDALDQIYTREGHASTCAEIVGVVLQATTSRTRYEYLCRRLLRCVVRSLEQERFSSGLPANHKTLYFVTAERIFNLHITVHTETALPTFVALLSYAAFQGYVEKSSLSLRQSVDVDNYVKAMYPVLSAFVEDSRPLPPSDEQPQHDVWIRLKGEGCLTALASMIIVMMDITQWAMVKRLVAYSHHVLCEGRVDGYARLTQPAHMCFDEVAHTMRAALNAVAQFQWHAKRSIDAKKEDRQRALEARSKRESNGFTKAAMSGRKQGPLALILHAAKEVHEVCARTDNRCVPNVRPVTSFSATTLTGLRTLLACAPPKSFSSLANVVVQSGYFPPFKFGSLPFAYGHRHVVVVPDTQCVGLYWSKLWLSPAGKYFETNVPLYAKIAAQYIYSQLRFTHLFFSVVGFGMAGPIADCLMQLIPAADAQIIITLGGPASFSNPKGTAVPCASVHAVLEDDLCPHLMGCGPLPHLRARFIGRMEGLGAVLPLPPSKRQLQSAALYGRYHGAGVDSVVTVFRGNGAAVELIRSDVFSKQLDLRKQFVGVSSLHYLEAIIAFSKTQLGQEQLAQEGGLISPTRSFFSVAMTVGDKQQQRMNTAVASTHRPWYPAEVGVLQELSGDGTPSDKLRASLKIPSSVEPNVLTHDLMALTYPKVVHRILKGVLLLNDEYGFDSDGQTNATAVERILKCRTMEQLVYVLQSYVGASWYPEYFAMQLCEWSGVEQGLNRQSLNRVLVESLIAKHSFLFTMCPDTSKSSENGTVIDKLTKHLSEDAKATFAGPMGYHVGWSVALCHTLPSVNTQSIINALVGASCQSNGISDVHPRSGKNMLSPAIRFTYTPPPSKVGGGGKSLPHTSSNVAQPGVGRGSAPINWVFVQMNFLDVAFDGSNAAQSLMRCAEQCIWVAQDEYSFQHLVDTVDLSSSDSLRQYLIYCPKGAAGAGEDEGESPTTADVPPLAATVAPLPLHGRNSHAVPAPAAVATSSPLAAKMKAFADSRSIPFLEFYPKQPDSAATLIAMLMKEVSTFVRVPVNPSVLPRNIHTGGLYTHDDDEIGRMIRKGMSHFIKPNTPPGQRNGGGGVTTVLSLQSKDAQGGAVRSGRRQQQ